MLAGSDLYGAMWSDPEATALFGDGAEIAGMIRVEAALARVQGRLGVIPAECARIISEFCETAQIAPAALAAATARDGVPVPGLVAALRSACPDAGAAGWIHWGATSQDIVDTGLALRLSALCDLWGARLAGVLAALADLAEAQADTPMAARTYGQDAVPTSFGAAVAAWGWPLIAAAEGLAGLRSGVARVSLAGAAGTLAAMGPQGPAVRAGLAAELGLTDPGHAWHSGREGVAALAGWAGVVAGPLGKLGEDVHLMAQSGLGEVGIAGAGGSSTMPQKQNPIPAAVLSALARHVLALVPAVQGAGIHRQQRDGAAWFGEWLALPPLCLALSRALALAGDLAGRLVPDPVALARPLTAPPALIHAEAVTFALAARMPRPEAARAVAALCSRALAEGRALPDLARAAYPWLAALPPDLGLAPAEARDFAARARHTARQITGHETAR
jgi:3-carboxy-cis,cis-muconate cycloisomerase